MTAVHAEEPWDLHNKIPDSWTVYTIYEGHVTENLTSAFRKTGIHPINKKMIADSDIAPSLVYNQHNNNNLQSSSHHHAAYSTEPHSHNKESEDSKNSHNSTSFASKTIILVLQRP